MQIVPYPFPEAGKEIIKKSLIQQQGNVIFPTETYYAVGCLANSSTAVKHVYRLKKRAKNQPLLVLVDSWEMLETYTEELTSSQRRLLEKYWPGALTAILPSRGNLAPELNYTSSNLAFRMTSSPIAKDLIQLTGFPLVGTSANLSGEEEISDFSQAYRTFGDHVELYIDGGKTPGEMPSTLIDMTGTEQYTLLRQGAVHLEE